MIIYKCSKCGKMFNHKNDYKKHLNRKTPCFKPTNLSENKQRFECSKCNKTYSSKSNLNTHIQSSCSGKLKTREIFEMREKVSNTNVNINDDILNDDLTSISNGQNQYCTRLHQNSTDPAPNDLLTQKVHQCTYCNNTFTRSYSLKRHMDRCKIKKQSDNDQETLMKIINEKNEEIRALKEMYKNPNNMQVNNNSNNTTNNTVNNTTNNTNNITNNTINNIEIQLLAYGQEDLSHLSDHEYKKLINRGYQSVQELIKVIHFNENKPENHNVYISNMRDKYVIKFNGKQWELDNKTEIVNELYTEKKELLEEKYQELYKGLSKYAIGKFSRFLQDIEDEKNQEQEKINNKRKGIEDKKQITTQTMDDIKKILYNKRHTPMKTRKNYEKNNSRLLISNKEQ